MSKGVCQLVEGRRGGRGGSSGSSRMDGWAAGRRTEEGNPRRAALGLPTPRPTGTSTRPTPGGQLTNPSAAGKRLRQSRWVCWLPPWWGCWGEAPAPWRGRKQRAHEVGDSRPLGSRGGTQGSSAGPSAAGPAPRDSPHTFACALVTPQLPRGSAPSSASSSPLPRHPRAQRQAPSSCGRSQPW